MVEIFENEKDFLAYFTMDPDTVIDEVGGGGAHGHVGVTSRGLGGRVLDVPEESLCTHFKICCNCIRAVFTMSTPKHNHNGALVAREAALPLSQGHAAVLRHHRLQVQRDGQWKPSHSTKK